MPYDSGLYALRLLLIKKILHDDVASYYLAKLLPSYAIGLIACSSGSTILVSSPNPSRGEGFMFMYLD